MQADMKTVYIKSRKALAFFGKPSDPGFWDRHWARLPSTKSIRGTYFTYVLKKYLNPEDGPILEGGCGLAENVYTLNRLGYKALGLDFAEDTVKRLNTEFPEMDIRHGDIRCLPFDNNFFAGYLSLGVIEHFWSGYESIISEMYRVLKPGGYLFLTFPYMSPVRLIKSAAGLYCEKLPPDPENSFYQFALNRKEVEKQFSWKGFSLIHSQPMDGIKGFKDEIPFGKQWLQEIYSGQLVFRHKGRLDYWFSLLSGHILFLVFKKNPSPD